MKLIGLARLLLTVLAFCPAGCATIGGSTAAATSAQDSGWLARVFRRSEPTSSIPPNAMMEVPSKLKNPAQLSLAYAQLMSESGNLPEAESHFNRVLKEKPENVDAIVGLAKVHQMAGRIDVAEQTYHRALKCDPHCAAALHGLGQTYAARQRWDEAAELLNQAVLASPNDGALRYDLAVALVQTGNIPAALPHFISTVGDAEAHYNIGLILHRQGKLSDSEQHFRIALTKKPDLDQARYWLDTIHHQQADEAARAITNHAPAPAESGVRPVSYEVEQPAAGPYNAAS